MAIQIQELQYFTISSDDEWRVISGSGQKSQSVICLHETSTKFQPIQFKSRLNQIMVRDLRIQGVLEFTPPDDDLLLLQFNSSSIKTTLPYSSVDGSKTFYDFHIDVVMGQNFELAPNNSVLNPLITHGFIISFNIRTEW